jgi:protein kinase C substrate 80K-H
MRSAEGLAARTQRLQRLFIAACCVATARAFECDGGTLLVDERVNDDFCDCKDGTDEAATGACNNQPFVCPCKPHTPKVVFASRVNDGICDCCDGADEYARPGTCSNTCVDDAKATLEVAQRAAVKRMEREASGKTARTERAKRLSEARANLETNARAVEIFRDAVARAEAMEAERRTVRQARLAANEVATALQLGELSIELLGVVIARLALAKLVEGVDALHEALKAIQTIGAEMVDVDSADMLMVAMEAKEDADAPACTYAHSACGREAELLALLPIAQLPTSDLIELVQTFSALTGQMPLLPKVVGALLQGVGRQLDEQAAAAALALLEPFVDAEADAARAELKRREEAIALCPLPCMQVPTTARPPSLPTGEEGIANANQIIAELTPIAALEEEFGASQQWFALHSECFSASIGSFKYSLCPFGTFTQDGRSLGRYAGWTKLETPPQEQQEQQAVSATGGVAPVEPSASSATEPRRMRFEQGEPCNGTPRRASVLFVCGEDDKLEHVNEPSTCVYEARFATPSACDNVELRAKHERLAAAAEAAGLPYEPSAVLRELLGL